MNIEIKEGDTIQANSGTAYSGQKGIVVEIIKGDAKIKFDDGSIDFLPLNCIKKIK